VAPHLGCHLIVDLVKIDIGAKTKFYASQNWIKFYAKVILSF